MNVAVIEDEVTYLYDNHIAEIKELIFYEQPIPKRLQGVKFHEVRNSKENPKIGRNTPCNCGSGNKYKNCCIK